MQRLPSLVEPLSLRRRRGAALAQPPNTESFESGYNSRVARADTARDLRL